MKRITVADAIIFNEQGEILMLRRTFNPGAGKLDLIGGDAEKEETPEQTVVRETREESGLVIESGEKLGEFDFFERGEKTNHVFLVEIVGGEIKSSHEGEVVWIDPKKITEDMLAFPQVHLQVLSALKKHLALKS